MRRQRCIPVFTTFGKGATSRWRGVRFHEGFLTRHKGSPFSPSLSHEGIGLSLWLAFPPLRRWQAPQPLHKLHEGEARVSSQSSTKRTPRHQLPSQLGGHPPRVTNSRSLTRTNRNGELNTYARMQSKTTKGAQILHSQISPKQ